MLQPLVIMLLAVGLDGEHATSPDLTYSTATGLKMKVASPLLRCEAKRVNSWKHLWPSTIPLCVCVCVFLKLPSSGDELAGVQLKEKDGQGWNESCGDGRKGKSE